MAGDAARDGTGDGTGLVVRAGGRELDGVVRPGESWLAAARRTCAAWSAEPVPVDLSGDVKVFDADPAVHVAVRAMTRDDLATAVSWRSDPVVRQWWSPGEIRTEADIAATYAARIDGQSPTRMWVVEANGHAAGFVQDYRIADYPDFARLVPDLDPDAIGLDYALGDPRWRGRGVGVSMVWAWALRARHRFPDAAAYFAAPDHRNSASLRMLARAGFAPGDPFDEPRGAGGVDTVVGHTFDVAVGIG